MWMIKPLDAEMLPEVTAFIARMQADPAHHIAYIGPASADEVAGAFSQLEPSGLANSLVALDEGQIVGALGADVSAELRRVWWYGPLVEHPEWDAVADALYQTISASPLLDPVRDEELYVDAANQRVTAFGQRQGFAVSEAEIGLSIGRDRQKSLPSLDAPQLLAAWRGGFSFLHDRLFPKTTFSGSEIMKRLGPHDRVFAVVEGGIFLGYAYARAEPEYGEGILEYVGVAEPARRRGIGYQLTVAALRWLFSFPEIETIQLTAGAQNTPALGLFEQLGFKRTHIFLPLRKSRLTVSASRGMISKA